MKKIIAFILVLVVCLSLCACGNENQETQPQIPTIGDTRPTIGGTSTDNTNQAEEEPLIIQNPDNGKPMINTSRFNELIETVELTTENWMEYIEVCSYTKKTVEKDAFGKVTSIETNTVYELGAKGNEFYTFNDFAIELKNKTTGALTIFESKYEHLLWVSEDFCLDEYECTQIKGTLSLVDIPDEVITVYPDTDIRVYCVGDSNGYTDYILAGVDGRRCGIPF